MINVRQYEAVQALEERLHRIGGQRDVGHVDDRGDAPGRGRMGRREEVLLLRISRIAGESVSVHTTWQTSRAAASISMMAVIVSVSPEPRAGKAATDAPRISTSTARSSPPTRTVPFRTARSYATIATSSSETPGCLFQGDCWNHSNDPLSHRGPNMSPDRGNVRCASRRRVTNRLLRPSCTN